MRDILKEIEGKYPVNTILIDGEQVWPYLRITYHFQYVNRTSSQKGERPLSAPLSFVGKLRRLPNVFYGMKNWLGKYDYIAVSGTNQRRLIGGKYFNRLLDPVIDRLGRGKVLYIEIPAPSLYPIAGVYTNKVVCCDVLELLAMIAEMFTLKRYRIENESILEDINKEYDLGVDYLKITKRFHARRRVFSWLFRMKKPKVVLLSCYYGHLQSAIKAAKDLGIKVIEFQHGSIGEEHPAYNVYAELDKGYFPDYLAVFGKKELETFTNSRFIQPQHVYPVGSFYIEYVKANHVPDRSLVQRLKNYKVTIGVTMASTTEGRVIEFVCRAAALDGRICYLLIPRYVQEEHYSSLELPDNVIVVKDENFYELMMLVDFHATVYSTCAIEAPSLGVQNILINIDGLSKRFYGNILNDNRVTRFADTPQELVSIANSFEKYDRDTIVKLNEDLIATDYTRNIQDLLRRPPFS
ncbi:hypothetical protein ACFLW7_02795 [Chloroflexota bacterium]